MNLLLILIGKFFASISRLTGLGNGSTWPGHIALFLNPNFIKQIVNTNRLKIILIAGTNGKTTTGKLIQTILEKSGKRVFQNQAGANLLNGIASSILLHSSILCAINYDFAIFETDENTLPLILREINNPDFIIILNLFRDQLDRYGEVNSIFNKWSIALANLDRRTTLILNADDPQVASLASYRIVKAIQIPYRKRSYASVFYFGLNDKKLKTPALQHASDSTYCPNCGSKLSYSAIFYSHLGIWKCSNCKNSRPELNAENAPFYPLSGTYNRYNTIAAVSLTSLLNISKKDILSALKDFKPAFGRQEILDIYGKQAQVFLSKNPTSFNESLRTLSDLNGKNVLFVLNDRIPDGRDVSWIWDIDFEDFSSQFTNVAVSGDRAYDMGLRIKYSFPNQKSRQRRGSPKAAKIKNQNDNSKFKIIEDLKDAIGESLKSTKENETLHILPTYSAMLEVRKILTGKKIL